MEVEGVRLHYSLTGSGPPVVLLHGASILMQDWQLAADRLGGYRILNFDRPGYGYSSRPGRGWSPTRQADLLVEAWQTLGLDRPIVVGQSMGATVALAAAVAHPSKVGGLVLIGGPYYPERRPDAALFAGLAGRGPLSLLRHSLFPLLGRLLAERTIERIFSPDPVPDYYAAFPRSLTTRPSQLFATGDDLSQLRSGTARMAPSYRSLSLPVAILAGTEDQVVDPFLHSVRLHRDLPASTLRLLPGRGHMLHHVAKAEVAAALAEVCKQATSQGTWEARKAEGPT